MSEEGELAPQLVETTPELEAVDLAAIEAEIDKKESGLSERKQKILKKVAPLLIVAASFLAACQSPGTLTVAVVQEPTPTPIVVQTEERVFVQEEELLPAIVYEGETHKYEGETERIIENAKRDFGVEIISPTAWMVDEEIVENRPWETWDIAIVAEAISQLPPAFRISKRAPLQVLLLRLPGSMSEGAGGGYAQRNLTLYTSEAFSPDSQIHGAGGELYSLQRDHLRAAVHHEYTHSFTEAFPELVLDWVKQTGWIQDPEGKWINQRPENLIHDGGADQSPWEDIAVSTSLMLVNPSVLSQDRREFFLTNPHFSNWPTVLDYKKQ